MKTIQSDILRSKGRFLCFRCCCLGTHHYASSWFRFKWSCQSKEEVYEVDGEKTFFIKGRIDKTPDKIFYPDLPFKTQEKVKRK